jgi:hypothetical protein
MKREYTEAEKKENNQLVAIIADNILVERQRMNGKIILWDFQQEQETDRLYYHVATLMSDVLSEDVYLEMPLFDFLIFKWKRRKGRKNLKRVNSKIKNEIEINDRTSIYEIMMFIQKEFNLASNKFEEINDCFYGEWIE